MDASDLVWFGIWYGTASFRHTAAQMVVVPDKSIQLTAIVDTITSNYDAIRGERSDIQNPINDGIGLI